MHSDQGVQFTSKVFTEFCKENNTTQSMSKVGYPYDNAPMERYFNMLKNECINLYEFKTEEALYKTVSDFAYVEYNYVRPHSYNNYATPRFLGTRHVQKGCCCDGPEFSLTTLAFHDGY